MKEIERIKTIEQELREFDKTEGKIQDRLMNEKEKREAERWKIK